MKKKQKLNVNYDPKTNRRTRKIKGNAKDKNDEIADLLFNENWNH